MNQQEENTMLGGQIGPALGGVLGAPIGIVGGLFGGRSKKKEAVRQHQTAADAAWSDSYQHLRSFDAEMEAAQRLYSDIDDLRRALAGMEAANFAAVSASLRHTGIPAADFRSPWPSR